MSGEPLSRPVQPALAVMQAIIEETPLVIYAKDEQLRFILSNRMHAGLLGMSAAEVLGRTDTELFGTGTAAEIEEASARVLEGGQPIANEYTLPLNGEDRTWLETIFPIASPQGQRLGLGGIATDITARRALEHALEQRARELQETIDALNRARDELVQKQKMASLGSLVAGVAHEINTPLGVAVTAVTHAADRLSAIEASAQSGHLTRGGLRSSLEELREAIGLALSNLERGAGLVQSFKQVAVDQTSESPRESCLDELLRDVVSSLSPLTRRVGLQPEVRTDGRHRVRIDAGALVQVVTNLVQNACVHAFEGRPEPRLLVLDLKMRRVGEEPAALLEVWDNGAGMEPQIAAQVFEPFFTTRRAGGGSGLGMHITHNLVTQRFLGDIALRTAPGEGTRWSLRLPLGTPALTCLDPA